MSRLPQMESNMYFGNDLSIYREIPVSVDDFINDSHYIGEYTKNGSNVFQFWRDVLNTVFMHDRERKVVIASTGYSTGKTEFCNIALAYSLYLVMCLDNPSVFFKCPENDPLTFVLCDIDYIQYNTIFDILKRSPWFNLHGVLNRNMYDTDKDIYTSLDKNIILTEVRCDDDMLGKNIFTGAFIWTQVSDKEDQASKLYLHLMRRVETRTTINGNQYGYVFVDIEKGFGKEIRDYQWFPYTNKYRVIDDSSYDTRIVPDVMSGVRYKGRFGVF